MLVGDTASTLLTQARTQAALRRHFVPSSPTYLVRTLAPKEKPIPRREALGYRALI